MVAWRPYAGNNGGDLGPLEVRPERDRMLNCSSSSVVCRSGLSGCTEGCVADATLTTGPAGDKGGGGPLS